MRLRITHTTVYRYDRPVVYGLQELRLRPRTDPLQAVVAWEVDVDGATPQVRFEDQYANLVELVRLDAGASETTVVARGEVDTFDRAGVLPRHAGFAPLWLFNRATARTTAGPGVRRLAGAVGPGADVERLHELAVLVGDAISFDPDDSDVASSAEDALAAGRGVCQDHAHAFIAAARLLGHPARYVSGYLFTEGLAGQEASHAWAEVWIDGLGWVGFDPANGISPDERYVRLATGLDYDEAAPVAGIRFGDGAEEMGGEELDVSVQVEQVQQ